jgi:RNA-binding protein
MPSGPLRKRLRAVGHHLSPIVYVGKDGVTDPVLRHLAQTLRDHELVKVKIGTESPEDRFEASDRLGAGAEALLAQILGRTLLLYKKHPEKPRFEAPPGGVAPAPGKAARVKPRPRPGPSGGGKKPRSRSGRPEGVDKKPRSRSGRPEGVNKKPRSRSGRPEGGDKKPRSTSGRREGSGSKAGLRRPQRR